VLYDCLILHEGFVPNLHFQLQHLKHTYLKSHNKNTYLLRFESFVLEALLLLLVLMDHLLKGRDEGPHKLLVLDFEIESPFGSL